MPMLVGATSRSRFDAWSTTPVILSVAPPAAWAPPRCGALADPPPADPGRVAGSVRQKARHHHQPGISPGGHERV